MRQHMKATVLVDNIGNEAAHGEWGLAIYIEYEDKRILLDVGSSGLFAENAEKLGIDLSTVDFAVLSHAHYDHSRGMRKFFEINKNAPFYLRETTEENCYFKKFFVTKYIGIPRNILTDYAERFVVAKGDYKICEGVYLIPHHTTGLERIGRREMMYQKQGKRFVPDNFSHEQSLVFETEKGLVIFNSCSHGGAANIINEVSKVFPDKKVYGIIGGFHLFRRGAKDIVKFAKMIKETNIDYVCTGHCTGDRAYDILKGELQDKLCKLHVGLELEF